MLATAMGRRRRGARHKKKLFGWAPTPAEKKSSATRVVVAPSRSAPWHRLTQAQREIVRKFAREIRYEKPEQPCFSESSQDEL